MNDLKAQFEAAVALSKTLTERPDNQSWLYRSGGSCKIRCLGDSARNPTRGGNAGVYRRSKQARRLTLLIS